VRQIVCVRAFGNFRPGDITEVPDDASVSPLHWAEPGSVEAVAAQATAKAQAPPQPPAAAGPPKPPVPSPAVTAPQAPAAPPAVKPDSKEGA